MVSDTKSGHFAVAYPSALGTQTKTKCVPGTVVVITTSQSQAGLKPTHGKWGVLCGTQLKWELKRIITGNSQKKER